MRLARVSIEGFRSIEKKLEMVIDPHVTVLLGANDHGKTNFLDALRLLNRERSYEADDLNWDCTDRADTLPAIEFILDLNESESEELVQLDAAQRLESAATERCVEREAEIGELREDAARLEERAKSAQEQVDSAKKAVDLAREAALANPESDENKEAFVVAQLELRRAKEAAAEAQREKEATAAKSADASVGLSLAEARAQQAKELRESGRLDSVGLQKAAERTRDEAAAAAKALKKAEGKTQSAEAKVNESPEGTDDPVRAEAQAVLQAAQQEEKAFRRSNARAQREAERERQAAEALEMAIEGNSRVQRLDLPVDALIKPREAPARILARRSGLKGGLSIEAPEGIEQQALDLLVSRRLPRVELVRPQDRLPDDVSAKGLRDEQNAFMRGIFLYAGIEEKDWGWIFTQDSRSRMRLEQASERLNERLRESWSQGRHLDFQLAHDSKRGRIALEIKDPSVSSRFTMPSQRSGGFTHFFALKTVLHAMQNESPASSYIWMFDEPGIHLHPDGQRDLIQVMETLSQANQVLYTTHSIFLANQNYPARHRLLLRGKAGTELDSKPYVSRWRTALAALGFSLAGTVLFAPHVLLVEGDSDAILITAVLRRLIADGHLDADLNRFSAIPTGDSANTGALIRILTDGIPPSARPKLALLVDGDEGGKARLKAVESLTSEHRIATKALSPVDTNTEDHLPAAKTLYLDAVVGYLTEICKLDDEKQQELRNSFLERFEGSELVGLAEWSRKDARKIVGLDEKPSPVGLARAYAERLEEIERSELKGNELRRAKKLADWVVEQLKIPTQTLSQDKILEPGDS